MRRNLMSLSLIIAPLIAAGPVLAAQGPVGPIVKQLLAVRGEVVRIKSQAKGVLQITVRPAKEYPEVTVLARENDLVGRAVGGSAEVDLLGLLAGDSRDDELITAAELTEGDIVSVIYDPQVQNRAIEIYIR
jgi:DNA-directed RNA polymerase subunit H (RpoH/RPB5)